MYYEKRISTDANTSVHNKKITNVRVARGVIFHTEIYFPAGQKGTCRVQLWHGGHQFVPATEGQFVSGDDRYVVLREFYNLKGGPLNIQIKTWNLSTRYAHEVMVGFSVLPLRYVDPMYAVNRLIEKLRLFMGRFGMG